MFSLAVRPAGIISTDSLLIFLPSSSSLSPTSWRASTHTPSSWSHSKKPRAVIYASRPSPRRASSAKVSVCDVQPCWEFNFESEQTGDQNEWILTRQERFIHDYVPLNFVRQCWWGWGLSQHALVQKGRDKGVAREIIAILNHCEDRRLSKLSSFIHACVNWIFCEAWHWKKESAAGIWH